VNVTASPLVGLRVVAGKVSKPPFADLPTFGDASGAHLRIEGKWTGKFAIPAADVACRNFGRAREYIVSTNHADGDAYGLHPGDVFLSIVLDDVEPVDEVDLTFTSFDGRNRQVSATASAGPGPSFSAQLHFGEDAVHRRVRFSARTMMGPRFADDRLDATGWVTFVGSVSCPG
jgi:hypothetical protein